MDDEQAFELLRPFGLIRTKPDTSELSIFIFENMFGPDPRRTTAQR